MLLNDSFCFCLFPLSCNNDALLALLFCPEQPQQCPQELFQIQIQTELLVIPLNEVIDRF